MDSGNVDIVLVRMDKIGDLVLSLPVDEHPALKGLRVHWLVTKGLSLIPQQSVPLRKASEFKRGFTPWEFWRLVSWFRSQRPSMVVLLHSPWWVSFAAWMAGVPERIGRLSQWHSFLFLNLPIRQKRSLSDRHESDFNFDLLEWTFNRFGVRKTNQLDQVKQTYLHLRAPNAPATLQALNLPRGTYRVVHPGMAGSALNWPMESYRALIEKLAETSVVVITGTKMDRKYLEGVKSVQTHPNVRWLVGELKMSELLDVLSGARSVVAPSTGVLHLAASLGVPVVGIYSPRRVESPVRWGPKGHKVTVLTAPAVDDAKAEVMSAISVEQVHRATLNLEAGDDRSSSHAPV